MKNHWPADGRRLRLGHCPPAPPREDKRTEPEAISLGNLRPAGELQENRLPPRQGRHSGRICEMTDCAEPGHRGCAAGSTQVFLQVPSTSELPVLAATLGAAS